MAKKLSEFLPPKFHSVWRATLNQDILNIVCKGGRGSGKSSDIAHIITQLLMRYAVNTVGIRYVDNTLEQSLYEQMKWAIEQQGVSHLFKFNKSPLRITYKPRGNYMIFRGAQNPERIKSLKDSKFPFAIGWIEELAEFKNEDEVTTITNSLLRGELDDGLFYKFFYSYNPPKRKQSWVNKKYETSFQPKNTFIHHSTYKDNPFISKEFLSEVEAARARNPRRAEWEYDGKAIGSGIVPFDNLRIEAGSITDEMVANFDNIRQGLDYGYATDPLAFVRWHYDKKRNCIYAIDELYEVKCSNRRAAQWIKSNKYHYQDIIAEVEPKSNAEMRNEHDISKIRQVTKGPDSVEYGEKWLDDLDAIYIDPIRTPNIAKEFENIDYQTDRDGNPKPRLEDKDNHTIDATRYAFNDDMRKQPEPVNVKKTIDTFKKLGL
ncbi:PBSX family phage terminase large subunit [Enterococcus faecium]|uniref:PBSX family phage terminase large subunit n=1 Tax=Enterococcus TaxID=1350 RepID=UPI000DEB5F97|nr:MULTISPECIES: PBSX family phage terminase large subunit [Enterococcus]EGO9939016.1 PBSX family phage terminase large subunit [Enterococcus faecium]EJC3739859.1 PBSX family phage terminase large subunit [Enterococcus faecium]EME3598972.1 PBSX family phage terminase large subunit [Enterococcus faecium]EME8230871.1 PBSX family phage terminase large subunit [Enterococcus faecium]MDQ8356191.1 PBSX family phage terminase large subunit [Enterococcus faecium]